MTRPAAVEHALDFIRDPDPDRFGTVALEVFAHQYEQNQPYGKFCRSLGRTPDTVRVWSDVPVLPTAAFKEAQLTTAPPRHVFETSGTTRGKTARGHHYLPDLDLYRASWEPAFKTHLLSDRERVRILSLIPDAETMPRSSLSFMVGEVLARFGTDTSKVFMGSVGLDHVGLRTAVETAVADQEPVLILGTAFALSTWLETLCRDGEHHGLPEGSRIMDTGGFKGQGRMVTRKELLELYERCLGVTRSRVVGEYGMTELCSQFYERTLVDPDAGSETYFGPMWTRSVVLSPGTLTPAAPGEAGLLAHWDLANAWSVMAVVTEDVGIQAGEGFRLLGRAQGAELRGCSLTTEAILDE